MSKSKVCLHWTALQHDCWRAITSPFLQSQCQISTWKKDTIIVIYICPKISRNRWCHVKQWCKLQRGYEQTPLVPVRLIIICTVSVGSQYVLFYPSTIRAYVILWTSNTMPLDPRPRPRPRLKGDGLKYAMLFSV